MTSGINGIGGNPFNYGNYGKNNQSEEPQENTNETQVQSPEYKPVNEETVMQFLNANNVIVPSSVSIQELDDETQTRIEGYMNQFEELFSVIEQEFGSENATLVFNMVMDRLMDFLG